MRKPHIAALALAGALLAGSAQAARFACPHTGGNFVFGQEANTQSLDMMASSAVSTRSIAMQVFETLITRGEDAAPLPELAAKVAESPDQLAYTFTLRPGVSFHNGKKLTTADVVASFERYARMGLQRNILDNVAGWEAPDEATFVIRLRQVQPTFLEQLSSFSVPVVIVPAEARDDPPQQLRIVGTGPWQLVEATPGSRFRLRRFDAYVPDTRHDGLDGFGGYKQACFDTVEFRIVPEPGVRVAGLRTGELQGVENLPTKSVAGLKGDANVTLLQRPNAWIHIAFVNTQQAPTDNLDFRRAMQAVLDMDEIMEAATDGNYRLNVGFAYPGQPSYTDAGKATYNIKDPVLAKKYLAQSGYKGEKVVLLTNKDYASMYNAALVMAEQMKAIGINAELRVVDWPTSSALQRKPDSGWNLYFTGWATGPALGPIVTMQVFVPPNPIYAPRAGQEDPELAAAFQQMLSNPDAALRQAAFARMQQRALEQVYVVPFGALTEVQAVRANVRGFKPYRIPRVSNVWFE